MPPLAVCMSPIPWGGLWTSRHEICTELRARGWDVVFVDPPSNAVRRPRKRGSEARKSHSAAGIRVVVPPPYLPFGVLGAWPVAARLVIERNARQYARFIAEAVGSRPVDLLINSFMPVLGHRAQELLKPRTSIYHRSDELRQFPGFRPAYREIEENVARAADVVICVSGTVRDGISQARPDAVVVPNGVDSSRFHEGVLPDARLSGLDRPVAVMVGVFDRRVDQGLLDAAASCSSLVMVGRLDGVEVPPGATWLGYVDHSEIPGVLAASDVGLVCYQPGWAGDVLKIYEYLAAGLPVVTSHAPDASDLLAEVRVAGEAGPFADLVRAEASQRTAEGDARRRSIAEANGWGRRVDVMLDLVGAR